MSIASKIRTIKPDTYFIITIVAAVSFNFALPGKRLIPDPYTFIGVIAAMVGYLIARKANSTLIKNKTTIYAFGKPTLLITDGPFKFSRNPIYLGMVIILLGLACFLGSLTPFIFPLLFVIIINNYIIPHEEKQLTQIFGEEYLSYKMKVRRWL